jgi:photosystem II stability/assembly factor-like uncharacterized protein
MNAIPFTARRLVAIFLLLGLALFVPLANSGGDKAKAAAAFAADDPLPDSFVRSLNWRCVGPANMGGRITAISVYESDPSCYYVATASGGLLKTVNNGIKFEHLFDKEATVSIGDVCVAPSNKDIVWVGSGENLPRNSVSYGDGVYKSTDGGKTWINMGLKETFQIGKILIHPTNPDIVYVGALGRLYGNNAQRGLFKTTDGGTTWQKVFYLDDRTGVIDMIMHPTDPDTLMVSMWERKRDGYDNYLGKGLPSPYDSYDPIVRFGASAGIYKTTDGGKNFKKMSKGLPTSKLGRIGLDWYRKDPKVVYAIVDCENIGKGTPPKKKAGSPAFAGFFGEEAEPGVRITNILPDSAADKAGLMVDDIILGLDKKEVKSYAAYLENIANYSVGDKVVFKIKREGDFKNVELTMAERPDFGGGGGGGGKGGGDKKDRPYLVQLGGQGPNVQDDQGPDGHEYGGVYRSDDGGESWKRVNSLNPRPMYFSVIRVDPSNDKYVYVLGVAQYRSSDGGKTFTGDFGRGVHADGHAHWIDPKDGRHMVLGCDGGYYVSYDRGENWDHLNNMALGQFYHVAACNKKPYWIYGGLQDNGSWGIPSVGLKGRGPVNEDVVSISGGDGFVCRVDPFDPDLVYFESQNGFMGRRNLRTGERATIRPKQVKGDTPYRFNWNTPFILSHHNSKIFYCAGNYVFKSLNKGDDLKVISPEITLLQRGSATALSESPKNPDVLWVGTDDGALWVTQSGGKSWIEIGNRIPMPGPRCVATIEASRFKEGRCYVAFDAHRSNDDQPYIFVTEDYGQSWAPLRTNLPAFGSTRCLREDIENENLLYCGTEFAMYVSINRGASWTKINNNLPTVAIHEVAIHPTAGEIAVATHGRSLWILDVSALRQTTPATLAKKVHLYKPATTIRWQPLVTTGGTNRRFVGTNPPQGAPIYYTLADQVEKVTVKILDVDGEVLGTLTGSGKPGLNRVVWSMVRGAADGQKKGGGKGGMGGGKGGGKGGGGLGGQAAIRLVPPGAYRVLLIVNGEELTSIVRIEADPNAPARPGLAQEDDELWLDPRRIN